MAAPYNEKDALIGNSYQSAKVPSLPDDDPEATGASANSIWHSKFNNKKTSGIFAMLVFIACVIFSYHIGLDKAGAANTTTSGGEMGAPALKGGGGIPCSCSDCGTEFSCPHDRDFCNNCFGGLTCTFVCEDCEKGLCSPIWCRRRC